MPAILDDPLSPPILRTAALTSTVIRPRLVTLRDKTTLATLIPLISASPHHFPLSLIAYLSAQLNREIEKGDTYPMSEPLTLEQFVGYWFADFAAVMLLHDWVNGDGEGNTVTNPEGEGDVDMDHDRRNGNGGSSSNDSYEAMYARLMNKDAEISDWGKLCLGSFYIKPNYPGRSSHVSNAGFIVTDGARNRGIGRLMGETYLAWAPQLGYVYSVFNLVYETNMPSIRIWDALGFKRIGRVRGCGRLKGHAEPVDALIFGRELGGDEEDEAAEEGLSEERFERIKFYLKTGKYPNGADRAEKSRLRSAAGNYRLVVEPAINGTHEEDAEKLFLRDKEVVSEPSKQLAIARAMHVSQGHGGINRTTAAIADKFHWVRIKDTVMLVAKECEKCAEGAKSTQ